MRTLALLLLFLPAQEPGRISLDRNGTIEEAMQALSSASGASIRVTSEVDAKAFPVQVRDARFFEALDAVCRAHGQARYLDAPKGPDEGSLEIRPGAWIEYPSCYEAEYKVIVSELAGFTSATATSNERWGRVFLAVFGPPWVRVRDDEGAKAQWTLDEALDANGVDLKIPPRDPDPIQRVDMVYHSTYWKANVVSRAFRLKPFDPDRGLRSLKGSAQFFVTNSKEITLPLAEGKTVETPVGTLTVDAVREPEQTPQGTLQRVAISLKPSKGIKTLRDALDGRFRCEGKDFENRVYTLTLPREGLSFEAVIRRAAAPPPAIRLIVRDGIRYVRVPFSFKDVRF